MVSIEYMVIGNYNTYLDDIYYCNVSEIGAYKRYQELKVNNKKIVKAKVTKKLLKDVLFIWDYEILEIIK